MRHEDASQSGLSQSAVDAHDDADHLAARDYGPATGNVITGIGTITGSTGADLVAPGQGHITAIEGAGGTDTSFSGGRLSVHGRYGTLSIDAHGNYSYMRDAGSPAGVSDVFHYTLANNAGASDVARLVINIGDLPKVATEGTRVVPGADGVVTLPAGVELSDVHVVGRDLVVTLPDGSTMLIVDGAVFVPQLVLGGVEVPATNLAALLIDAEPHPAAGDFIVAQQQSSGGNFEVPVAPLDPGVPLGDLLPPTELTYTPPEFHDIGQVIRNDPPLIGASTINVSEEGLPNGIADTVGTPDTTNSATANGTISVSDPNGDSLSVAMGLPAGSLTSGGVAITWTVSPDGHLLTGSAGTNPVVTISINNAGAYTVTLLGPVDHPIGGGEQGTDIVVPVSVSDGHAITTGGTITVTIEDDSPTIVGRFEEPTLVVDESVLLTNDTKSFAGAFSVNYGADGPAASNPLAYALGVNAGATGLFDTATGNQVVLTLDSGVVTGRAGAGGPIVFTVSVDISGNVTLDQQRAVVHSVSSNPDTSEGTGLSADNLITLSLVATDRDGDTASTTINIGSNLTFLDDGPSIASSGASEPSLVVDESNLLADASASFAGLFTAGSFGADGAGTKTYSVSTVNGTDSGLIETSSNNHVFLFNVGGTVVGKSGATAAAAATGPVVFVVSVDGTSGVVTLDQQSAVVHSVSSNPDTSEGVGLTSDGMIQLTATITDKDGDSATASVGIGSNLQFNDDGPSAAIHTTGQSLSIDESAGIQADSNDTTSAGVIALFAGVTNKGVDTDLPQYATNASAVVNSTGTTLGADGGTVAFGLNVSSAGVDSGLKTTDGSGIFLFQEGALIVGRVGSASGAAAFAIAIDSTGHISMVEYLSIQQPNAANPDDSVSITNGAILAVVTATDGDNDTNTASTPIGGLISFQDSGPILTAVDNINIQNSGDVAATGGFHYLLGADGAQANNDVFAVTGSATVNGTAVTNYTISETSENATTAVFTFGFDYPNGSGTVHETGTLTFDKSAGTYTVDLTDPIAGFSILGTAGAPASAFINYNADGTTSSGPSNIATVALSSNLYIQFTGDSGASHTTVPPDGTFVPTTGSFAGLELLTGTAATVTVSSSAAGVAGNTIQGGEVLDFNLYNSDPHQVVGTPTASATSMFIDLDGVGSSEDMIVVLKLYDTVTHTYTTEALMVQNGDIITSNATLAGTAYSGITLDNNDGLIVIEPNDYQNGNPNLVIVGAQIAGSDDGVTGTAINFNGALGASGGSSGTQPFTTDVSDQPFKIQNIGFLTTTTTNQNADLTFNVTVKDGDLDTVSQTIHATVTSAADSASAISLSAAVTTVAPVVLDLNGDGVVSFLDHTAGVRYDYNGDGIAESTAWAAAGDGILVRDANHNGLVDNASEFVFGANGQTDMEALHAQYGAQLDANDADFTQFAVWNDANSNGVVDANELHSLAEAGIVSINLVSDGQSYTTANGDVVVAGTATFTKADGSTGAAADAAFGTGNKTTMLDDRIAANSNNMVLAAAIAAAGFAVSTPAAASVSGEASPVSHITNMVVSAEPVDMSILHLSTETAMPALMGEVREAFAIPQIAAHTAFNGDMTAVSTGDVMMGHAAMVSPTALLAGSEMLAAPIALPMMASNVAMPSADAMMALGGLSHAQTTVTVDKIVAEALHGGASGPDINALLNALPTQGNAGNAGTEIVASLGNVSVPSWDTGHGAAFTFAATNAITTEAMVLHHDAIQPVANG